MNIPEHEVLARFEVLTMERLEICVTEAWVKPAEGAEGRVYDELDVARIALIVDLCEDMRVNDDALPIILSLIDQVHALRQRLFLAEKSAAPGADGFA
jgi:chaperone modulatory protein CbpM